MRGKRCLGVARLWLLVLICSASALAQATKQPDISFTVSMPEPSTHLLDVEMRVQRSEPRSHVNLIMPVWTPGSYMVREFARHVQEFAAFDGNDRSLPWIKTNKNTWRIQTGNARDYRVTYRVYANELTVRASELNADHAFWNNATLLMYPEGGLNQPVTLNIIPHGNWKIATGLPSTGEPMAGGHWAFRAENFDILYDSPVEVSNFKELKFEVRGVPHRIVIDGEGNYHPDRLLNSVRRIVDAQIAMFGEIPYRDYTFILHLRANTGGGLEHLNSTALGFRRHAFTTERAYFNFNSLVSHEFFHLWNVKRIRPDPLGPFDYTKENYTRLLWVAEGITEYYGNLMVRRAGLISDATYLEILAANIQIVQEQPGRHLVSVEEASFDAWIKYYRPDENSINSSVSYYEKGELLGMLLDLEIRRRTNGAKSLDDVMRKLNAEFAKKNRNYTPADFQRICEQIAGSSLEQFFSRYVRGREELPYNDFLSAAGLALNTTGAGVGTLIPSTSYLGADLEETAGTLTIKNVRAGSPAYEQGLNAKDQILALDGIRVNKDLFETLIRAKPLGSVVRVTLFRNEDLRTFEIKLGNRVNVPYRIVQLPARTDGQKQIYESWLSPTRVP
ncbi:MAG TPA: PDZ domain-containing protein [Pyrinomonadaceae bacterium]|nr:PDZ domain-containing protein [Pyrinomonadaceae bacterium]